jgi:hypothetical protein
MESNISELLGKIITKIDKSDDEILFTIDDGTQYRMYHSQDCCESVYVDDIADDLNDLIGSQITMAEEITSNENPDYIRQSQEEI